MSDSNVTKNQESKREEGSTIIPLVDVVEDAAGITLYVNLPGVPKDKLSVRVEAETLAIEGEVTLPISKDMQASHAEVRSSRYLRAFTLGQELDRDKVAAEFNYGVLKLHIPKAEHVKPRKIEVQLS